MKIISKGLFFFFTLFLSCSILQGQDAQLSEYRWTIIDAEGEVTGRHENAFIEYKDKFYLIGGRGVNSVNVFDPETNTWEAKEKTPMEIHHFQAVVYDDAIYILGAMTGGYPTERPLKNIWIYYPEMDKWEKGDEIPESRRRGGAGAVVHNGKIYMVCGIEYGHMSGTNNYFDSYDPKTGEWEILTKAPHIRDHFPAIVVGDRLYCIGGRNGSVHFEDRFTAFFTATVPQVDYYDFNEEKWYTMKETLPFPTAAGGIFAMDHKIVYMGGEGSQKQAYNQTQCLDLNTGKWSQLAPLNIGRHGTGAILYRDNIYIAAGSQNRGGGNMTSIELFSADHDWVSLFNGESLDGWSIQCADKDKGKGYWTVVDGAIQCDTRGNTDHGYMWLQSDGEYEDFELRLKFQTSRENRGNSGVQFRSRWDPDASIESEGDQLGWMDGPQADIDPDNPWRNGMIYDETRENRRWIYPSLPNWKIEKSEHAPKRVVHYFEDEETGWNDMTIKCDGMVIQTYVNNVLVSDFNAKGILDSKLHRRLNVGRRGHIALQLHKKSDNKIRFKDIEIRVLNN